MSETVQLNRISGFWRRVFAFVIDILFLRLVGYILGLALESTFVQMGNWGRFVGFGIALIYFGSMNSKLFHGQTIGKKLLNLRVVNSDNETISLGKSIFRYMVLSMPFSLNGVSYSSVNEGIWDYSLFFIIFGGLFSIFYLYIFNRTTRQSLHDLAVGAYVVNTNLDKQEVGEIWKTHLIVVVAMLFIVAVALPAFTAKLEQSKRYKDLRIIPTALLNDLEVIPNKVFIATTTFKPSNGKSRIINYFNVRPFLLSNNINHDDLARRLATLVVSHYPEAKEKDLVKVTLTYGYDIGIWAQWSNYIHTFHPNEL